MLRVEVSKFASQVILPEVRKMDKEALYDPNVLSRCFEQGLMGIETPTEYGGAG